MAIELEKIIQELDAKVKRLEERCRRLDDIEEITNLQERYHFYLGMLDVDNIMELFSKQNENVYAEIGDRGKYVGLEKIREVFSNMRQTYEKTPGFMGHIMGLNPVIEVDKDGKTASGLWYGFGPLSLPGLNSNQLEQQWLFGKYDVKYIKEDGEWKILNLHFFLIFRTSFHEGWLKQQETRRVKFNADPSSPASRHNPYNPRQINTFLPGPPERIK